MEKLIKDLPEYVKDTKTGAILLKKNKNPIQIQIDDLKKSLYETNKKLIDSNNRILKLEKLLDKLYNERK